MVDSPETKEKRVEDIAALMQEGSSLHVTYAGKKYMLRQNNGGVYDLYVDYDFTANNQGDRTQEVAGLMQVPEVVVHLDSCLNIISIDQYRGGVITQKTVEDVMDKLIRDVAIKQLSGGKKLRI